VCGGDGKSCLDCAGVPNGSNRYDVCDVCAGNGSSCRDCRGVPNGTSRYDVCDVCAGNGSTCRDCAGVPNGTSRYDVCDVCDGPGPTLRRVRRRRQLVHRLPRHPQGHVRIRHGICCSTLVVRRVRASRRRTRSCRSRSPPERDPCIPA
jgi:hypothetical protein